MQQLAHSRDFPFLVANKDQLLLDRRCCRALGAHGNACMWRARRNENGPRARETPKGGRGVEIR